jgi:hypothetical protein
MRSSGAVTAIVTPGRQAEPPDDSGQFNRGQFNRGQFNSGQFNRGQLDSGQLGSREHEMRQRSGRRRGLDGRSRNWRSPGWRPRGWRPRGQEPDPADRGSLTLMLVVMFGTLIALAGLVIDGGGKLAAAENADSVAQEAARAGAGIVDRGTAYANGQFVVNEAQAEAAAHQFLAAAGYAGSVGPGPAPNTIEVTVHLTEPTKVLSIIGINNFTVNGQATATLVSGVTGPGQ